MGKSKKEKKSKKDKKQKSLKHGHVIEKTIGSSNEISFDVLQKKKIDSVTAKRPDPWDISQRAVKKSYSSNFHSKLIVVLVSITIFLALTAIAILGVAAWMQQQSGSLAQLQTEIVSAKNDSVALSDFHESIKTLLTAEGAEISQSVKISDMEKYEKIAVAKKSSLEKNKENMTETLKDIGTPVEREIGNNSLSLINKELQVLEEDFNVLEYALPYLSIRTNAKSAFQKMTEANTADGQATTYLLKGTSDDAQRAIQAATESKNAVAEAMSGFESAISTAKKDSSVFSSSCKELESYVEFCKLYSSAQDATIAAASAYINRNSEELKAQNDTYNSLKSQASTIAKAWDREITDIIDEEFKSKREGDVDAFLENLKERNSIFERVQKYVEDNNL